MALQPYLSFDDRVRMIIAIVSMTYIANIDAYDLQIEGWKSCYWWMLGFCINILWMLIVN